LLQGAIRNISAFTAPGLRGQTSALPPARGPGPAAPLPPEPPAPAPRRSPILGELLEKQQPVCRQAAGSVGLGAGVGDPLLVPSENWVAQRVRRGAAGVRPVSGCPEGRAGESRAGGAVGTVWRRELHPGGTAPSTRGSAGEPRGDAELVGTVWRGALGALGTLGPRGSKRSRFSLPQPPQSLSALRELFSPGVLSGGGPAIRSQGQKCPQPR